MSPNEIATRAAEAVMRKIEETRRINKRELTEAIEGVLLVSQQHSYAVALDRPSLSHDGDLIPANWLYCGND